ncbi:MAG: hypothetical protein ACR2KK_19155 [Acidimicrobiales bacterium]
MRRSKWAPAVVAAALVAGGVAGCTRSSSSAAGRLEVDGRAEVTRPGEDRREVSGSSDLKLGDRVRVRQGSAVIRLPDDRRLELRVGSDVELQAVAADGKQARPTLLGGDLLVVSGGGPLAVGATGADVTVEGEVRVSRGVALLVAAYRGMARLSAGGSTLAVPALRQAALPATEQFPTTVSPLEYLPDDDWDQRYLSDAIDLSNRLAARSDGFTAQLGPTEGRSLNYFRDLFPRLAAEPAFVASLVNPSRPPGETLVGAAITLEGSRGTFVERWGAVFGFRDQGAPWGLVALDQGVDRVPVLASVEGAISRGPTMFAVGPPTRTPNSLAPPSAGPATTTAPRTTATTVRPRPGSTPTTTAPAPGPTTTTTLAGPVNTGAPLIDDTVNSVVDTLTALLRSLGQN